MTTPNPWPEGEPVLVRYPGPGDRLEYPAVWRSGGELRRRPA